MRAVQPQRRWLDCFLLWNKTIHDFCPWREEKSSFFPSLTVFMGLVSIAVSVKLSSVKTSLTARFRRSSVKGLCVPHRLLTTPLGLVLFRTLTEYAGFRKMKVKQQQGWGFFCSYILTAFSCHVLAQVQGENSQKVPEYAQNRSITIYKPRTATEVLQCYIDWVLLQQLFASIWFIYTGSPVKTQCLIYNRDLFHTIRLRLQLIGKDPPTLERSLQQCDSQSISQVSQSMWAGLAIVRRKNSVFKNVYV